MARSRARAAARAASPIRNTAETATDRQIGQTVDQINAYARQIQTYNLQMKNGDQHDPSVDAKIHTTLENLSQLANVAWTVAADGSVNVMLDGQTPLVVGEHQFNLSSQIAAPANLAPGSPPVPPSALILDSAGRDITAQATGGQLGALLDTHNQVLASLLGDANQPGGLNQLAQAFADRVNQLLTAGNISDGPPPSTGAPLFSYDTTNATNTAASLALDPAITPDQLAAIDPGPPYVSNGIALKLAALANPQDPADEINNLSYTSFFGSLATAVARPLLSSIHGELDQAVLRHLRKQTATPIEVQRARSLASDREVRIVVPASEPERRAVEVSVFRALLELSGQQKRKWWKILRKTK